MTDYSVWSTNGPNTDVGDPSDISRGLIFRLSAPGWLKKIRFYRGTTNVGAPATAGGPVVGRVYTVPAGAAVAGTDVSFTLSGTGWQEADVSPAVPLAANTTFKVAVLTGNYTATGGYFASGAGVGGIVSGIITVPDAGGNPSGLGPIQQGSFRQPTTGLEYPNQYFNGGNYWVDIVVSDTDPAEDLRDVSGSIDVTATVEAVAAKTASISVSDDLVLNPSAAGVKVASAAVTSSYGLTASAIAEGVGPGVTAPVSDVLCSSWANYVDVPQAVRDEYPTVTEQQWSAALMRASEILWALSGRRWYGGGCQEVATLRSYPPMPGEGTWPYESSWGRCSCWTYGVAAGQLLPGGLRHVQAPTSIKLPRSPVTAITSVTVGGDPFTAYHLYPSGWVARTDGYQWNVCGGDTVITYTYGEAPPPGGRDSVIELATEMIKDATGIGECRLPSNVTSITRQGVTITKLTTNDFLPQGRVGLPAVDLWLATVNPYARPRAATVWSPDLPHTLRNT